MPDLRARSPRRKARLALAVVGLGVLAMVAGVGILARFDAHHRGSTTMVGGPLSPVAGGPPVPRGATWLLPAPLQYTSGVASGFPHSTLGAIAAAAATTSEVYGASGSSGQEQRVLESTTTSDPATVSQFSAEMQAWGRRNGASPGLAFSASFSVVGCKVGRVSADSLYVTIEGYVQTSSQAAGPQIVAWPMTWSGSDWKTTAIAENTPNDHFALPPLGGWTSCRS